MSQDTQEPYTLRTTPTVPRALAETLPEAVAAAAYEFITGPLLEQPRRAGHLAKAVHVLQAPEMRG